jgi:low temperature requirement protein LtrA
VVAAALWWTYFDWVAILSERVLGQATGAARASLARDMYSYLHLPMVAGIVLFALAMKKSLEDVDGSLGTVPAAALCGGLAIYMLAHVLSRYRISGTIGHGRPVAFVVLVAVYPLAVEVPAVAALALVAAVFVGLIAYEAMRYRESRARIRGGAAIPELESVRESLRTESP